jgi:hypothetical protein
MLLLLKQMGGAILLIVFLISLVSIVVIWRYYRLYVAALVFSAKQHENAKITDHVWFIEVLLKEKEIKAEYPDLSDKEILAKLVNNRTKTFPHSFVLYAFILFLIGLVSGYVGMQLLMT